MTTHYVAQTNDNLYWKKAFFSDHKHVQPLRRTKNNLTSLTTQKTNDTGELWLYQLFNGIDPNGRQGDKMQVLKAGIVIHEILLQDLTRETIIGRHPDCDLQLESIKIAMFHAVIHYYEGKYYIENLDANYGALLNRKKLGIGHKFLLYDNVQIDIPDYRLTFSITSVATPEQCANADKLETFEGNDIPDFFYTPPPPSPSLLLTHLIEDRKQLEIWSEGTTELKVADIITETHDCKTFRFVGVDPILFSYKPGQFITFILTIDGQEVRRSYSMSSSPSRPHLLEITIKRVPDGLVSNWFCDLVKLGDVMTIKGPSGQFTCFNFPSQKILFVGAGSGITPILSMCRWIADTASNVDVKVLASFKSPADIIFLKEFEMLSARCTGFQVAITITSGFHAHSWTGFRGRVNPQMLNTFVPDVLDRDIFLCGPESFSSAINEMLRELDYNMTNYHTESFGTARMAQASGDVKNLLHLKGPLHKVKLTKSNKTVEIDEHISLLELVEAHGIEVDYSCRVGSCGECEIKCRGKVNVDNSCEIDKKSQDAGFIYSCCTFATSDLELDL